MKSVALPITIIMNKMIFICTTIFMFIKQCRTISFSSVIILFMMISNEIIFFSDHFDPDDIARYDFLQRSPKIILLGLKT